MTRHFTLVTKNGVSKQHPKFTLFSTFHVTRHEPCVLREPFSNTRLGTVLIYGLGPRKFPSRWDFRKYFNYVQNVSVRNKTLTETETWRPSTSLSIGGHWTVDSSDSLKVLGPRPTPLRDLTPKTKEVSVHRRGSWSVCPRDQHCNPIPLGRRIDPESSFTWSTRKIPSRLKSLVTDPRTSINQNSECYWLE